MQTVLNRNLTQLQQRILAACQRSGRPEKSVQLVAVTKMVPPDVVEALVQLGVKEFGENRPQQLVERSAALAESCPGNALHWHLIGPLQSNKIRSVIPRAALIHSVDSVELLNRISRIAGELGLTPRVLLQVNVSGEESKGGFEPDTLRPLWPKIEQTPHVQICGLMTMAPLTDDLDVIRSTFRGARSLRDELQSSASAHVNLQELSMGMSNDFEIAIEEGSTLIRVGSSLFEGVSKS